VQKRAWCLRVGSRDSCHAAAGPEFGEAGKSDIDTGSRVRFSVDPVTDAMVMMVPVTHLVGMGLRHFWRQGGERSHHHQAGEQYSFHLVHSASPEMGRTSRLRLLLERCAVTLHAASFVF
jgi:hypothetical protein